MYGFVELKIISYSIYCSFQLADVEEDPTETDDTVTNHTGLDLDIDETIRLPPSSITIKKV